MAFMDLPLDAPHKPNKGLEGGACNRQSCQAEPALWYNHGSYAWYCEDCAKQIGQDSFNLRDWNANWRPRLGHPQFETREMTEARRACPSKADPGPQPDPLSFESLFGESIEEALGFRVKPKRPKSASLQRMLKQAKRRK